MGKWRNSREYRIWKVSVIRRDKACRICNSRKGRSAHHMNSASYFIDERYDPENGICMCKLCHLNFHNNFKRSTREKCTKYDFANFTVLSKYLMGLNTKKVEK